MKVFVTTKETQGLRPSDFHWSEDGELVTFGFVCHNGTWTVDDGCGCQRSMTGVKTRKATTTFMVAEMDMTVDQLADKIQKGQEFPGYSVPIEDCKEEAQYLVDTAENFPVGEVLEIRNSTIWVRNVEVLETLK